LVNIRLSILRGLSHLKSKIVNQKSAIILSIFP
jgi:hypothetical protein